MFTNTSDSFYDEHRSHHNNINDNINSGNVNDNLNYSNEDYEVSDFTNVSPALMDVTKFLSLYVQPFLCLFGIAVHSLSIVIFLSKSFRKRSSYIYLAALSGSSVGFNLVLLLQWLEMVNVQLMHETGFCQEIVYFGYVFRLVICINERVNDKKLTKNE